MTDATIYDEPVDSYAIEKLEQDLRVAARIMGRSQVRFLVDHYYSIQEYRKSAANQERALKVAEEPVEVLGWFFDQSKKLEKYLQVTLDLYSDNHPVGHWAREIKGVGPVIAAGFISHIDISKAQTVGQIWRFAGLDCTVKWEKGCKRPWNAALKVLCWKLGDSFVKWSGGDNPSPYGIRYLAWKKIYMLRNERGDYVEEAKETLATRKFRDDSDAKAHYEAGRLPPGRIDLRARRKATKLFLSHLHEFWYEHHHKCPPPVPYAIEHLGHAHYIGRPDKLPKAEWQSVYSRTPFDDEMKSKAGEIVIQQIEAASALRAEAKAKRAAEKAAKIA